MSQPEIFRRCSHCGASSKPGELFCAQCGNALVNEKSDQTAQPIPRASDLPAGTVPEQESVGARDTERSITFGSQTAAQPLVADAEPAATMPNTAAVTAPPRQNPAIPGQRTGLAPRGGSETRLPVRGEKLRRVSSVVLDEAAYDSSLRFILVVFVLFVLFLVLLFLSKWMV
jgi:hypothetical protein